MPTKKFPALLYSMVNAGFEECGWTAEGDSFWISNPERLASSVIPQFFGHSSYASLHRSLNSYDFHKATPSTWKHVHFHRDRPQDIEKITRKVSQQLKGIKAVLEEERRQAAQLLATAEALEQQLRQEQEADAAAQERLEKLQAKAAEATLELHLKMSHPLASVLLKQEIEEEVPMVEMADTVPLHNLEGVTLQDLNLSRDDLKPEAARILDSQLAANLDEQCTLQTAYNKLWTKFEAASKLSDADLAEAFKQYDDGTGLISREDFQSVCFELWKLGPGPNCTNYAQKCPYGTARLKQIFEALETAAQVEPEYEPVRLARQTTGSSIATARRSSLDGGSVAGSSRTGSIADPADLQAFQSGWAQEHPNDEWQPLSEDSLQSGRFRFDEFRAMMHAWKDWHVWQEMKESDPTLRSPSEPRISTEALKQARLQGDDDICSESITVPAAREVVECL